MDSSTVDCSTGDKEEETRHRTTKQDQSHSLFCTGTNTPDPSLLCDPPVADGLALAGIVSPHRAGFGAAHEEVGQGGEEGEGEVVDGRTEGEVVVW
jgi:hypothetical protein